MKNIPSYGEMLMCKPLPTHTTYEFLFWGLVAIIYYQNGFAEVKILRNSAMEQTQNWRNYFNEQDN
jgi:hypothetical protein